MKWKLLLLVLTCLPAFAQAGRTARPKVQRPDGPVWDIIRRKYTGTTA